MSTEITVVNDIVEINVQEDVIVIEAPSGAYPLPTGVYSVYGRTGNVVAQDGDYNLTQLGDVTITSPATGQVLRYNGTTWVNSTESYVGTVTSVAMTTPTGLTVTGSPITTAGTLAVGLQAGYSIPTDANQSLWTTAYNDKINSAFVTGTTTKTLTLNQQDGGTVTATWSDLQPVTSVFGRIGDVVATSGDYNTLQVTENTNLYFTDQRARYAISGDAASGVVYSNTTGIIALDDIPNTSLFNDSVTINSKTVALGDSTTLTTTDIGEGTNLYFTTTRAQDAISGTAPISVASGVVSISQANTSTNGYLSSTDWNTFNAKQSTLTLGNLTSSDITVTGGSGAVVGSGSTLTLATVNSNVGAYGSSTSVPTITVNAKGLVTAASETAIPTATSSVTGLLTSTDWSTFNAKQAQLNGTGFVKVSGTTVSYDNSTYLTTIEGIAAGGELSGTYASPSLVNSAVTGKVLTGLNVTGGTVVATDSILDAFGKVQNQINGLIGGSIYQGVWNASTNTPTLVSSVGVKGYYYIVNVAGTTNLNGITDWQIGDWAIFDGLTWQKVDNTDAVVSVNGFTGAVSLTTSNIAEGTNEYFTTARARQSVSAGTGISYDNSTGVITNTAPDQVVGLTGGGTTSITGTYPNFTITSNDQYVGTVTSVGITESAAALTITGSPVTTSGNINIGFAGASTDYVAGDGSLVTFPSIPSITGLVPYTGATTNVDLGTHTLSAANIVVNHTSGSGVAASITKGGNGEALTVVKSSGSGNAASITGGVTLLSELNLTTDLADDYIASAATWNAKQNAITLTTTGNNGASTFISNTLNIPTYTLAGLGGINLTSLSATSPLLYDNTTGVFSIQQASGSQAGYLSSADWTTFNSKQNALTNPVTGTGTTNYLPKFTGASTLGNSLIFDNGTNVGIGTSSPTDTIGYGRALDIQSSTGAAIYLRDSSAPTTQYGFFAYDGNDNGLKINNENSSGFIRFNTNGSERMRITSTGNVGIGTSSPTEKLHLYGGGGTGVVINMQNTTVGGGTVSLQSYGTSMYINTEDNIIFRTQLSTSNTERMRITSAGVLDFNGTGDVASINDKLAMGYRNGNYGWIQSFGGTALYLNKAGNAVYAGSQRIDNNSDQRLKENITSVENALDIILNLKGRKFNMIDENGKLRYGFVAQEVQPHLSDFVIESDRNYEKDDVKIENLFTLESSGASWAALLVEAIKELSAKVSALENKS